MEIIREGTDIIRKLLQIRANDHATYRINRYILSKETSEGLLLCNTITGELTLLSNDEKCIIETLPGKLTEPLLELFKHGYIVPVEYDEKKIVEQLRLILIKSQGGYYRNYVILPTTYCNARCFYCYESEIKHVNMSMETAIKLVDFIEAHCGKRKISISWFGGEPLLRHEIIDRICSELKDRNISFASKMVSNGYLFDDYLIYDAVNHWNLKSVQITLDGSEEIYNRTKSYIYQNVNAYEKVLHNINNLLDNEIKVQIRLNLDNHNKRDLKGLIDDLDRRINNKNNLVCYVRVLNENTGFSPLKHEPGEIEKLQAYADELEEYLVTKGMKQPMKALPHLKINHCMADGWDQLLCSPSGLLGKCEHYIEQYYVGSIFDGVTNSVMLEEWKENKYYIHCDNCPIFATCIKLKKCPVDKLPCSLCDVEKKEDDYKEAMLNAYYEYKESHKLR